MLKYDSGALLSSKALFGLKSRTSPAEMKLSHKEIISCYSFCCESSSGELKGKLRVLTSPTGRAAREGVAMGAEPGDVPWSPSSPHWCWPPWNFPLHRHLFLPAPLVVLRSLSVINSLNWQPNSSPYFLSSSFTKVFKNLFLIPIRILYHPWVSESS